MFSFHKLSIHFPTPWTPTIERGIAIQRIFVKIIGISGEITFEKRILNPPPLSPYQQFIEKMSSKECGPLIKHFKSQSLRVLGAKFERNRLQVLRKSYRYSHSWAMITRKTYLNLWWFWAILRWAEMNCECVPCNVRISKLQLHEH